MGPLVTREHHDRVRDYVDLGVQEGATLVVDGRQHAVPRDKQVSISAPLSSITCARHAHLQGRDLRAGAGVVRVPTLDAALELVNAHEFGNGTAIFTGDG